MDPVTEQIGQLLRGEQVEETERESEGAPDAGDAGEPESGEQGAEQHDQAGAAAEDAGADIEGDGEGDGDGEGSADDVAEAFTLADLAKELGVDVKDVYDVEIPLGDGESMTLGELKDRAREVSDIVSERQTVETKRGEMERDLLAARQELETALAGIDPAALSPELVARARERLAQTVQTESRKLLDALPSWKDPDTQRRDRQAIREYAKGYGFSEAEIDSVFDARLVLMIKQAAENQERLQEARRRAEGKVKRNAPGKPTGNRRADPPKSARLRERIAKAKQGTNQDKVSVIGEMLRG